MGNCDYDALDYLEGRCLDGGEYHFADNDFAYGYGDFVILSDGRHGMVVEVIDEPDDWYYNVQLFDTKEIVEHIPQGDLELYESEIVEA